MYKQIVEKLHIRNFLSSQQIKLGPEMTTKCVIIDEAEFETA